MEEEGSYGIVSYRELAGMKKELEDIKGRSQDTSKPLLDSMAKLTTTMDSMLQLFKSAADELKVEEASTTSISKEIGPISEKLDRIMIQTKTIAESMVAIADMVKELKQGKVENRISQPMPPPQPQPAFMQPEPPQQMPPPIQGFPPPQRQPQQFAPPQMQFPPPEQYQNFAAPPGISGELPPLEPFPPAYEPKKKGLFGRFKK